MSNEGKSVKVHYTGKLKNGEVFDSSEKHGQPLAFKCMAGQMIPGFDNAVKDMTVGEKKTIEIPSDDAYGAYNEELLITIPTENMAKADELKVGDVIQVRSPDGRPMVATVKECGGENIVLDLNHELAGKDLIFEIELLSAE